MPKQPETVINWAEGKKKLTFIIVLFTILFILYRVELCAAAAADQMSASRRRRFREVFTSRCTPAIYVARFL